MTESKKQRLREQRESEKCRIDDFCKENGIDSVHLTEYQIRLNGYIDIYPTNQRFCILSKRGGKWGRYNRVEELLEKLK